MAIINVHDVIGGAYMDEDPSGVFGRRCYQDRRYWTAWAGTGRFGPADCHPGVMDDFGTLVPVPFPSPQPQQ